MIQIDPAAIGSSRLIRETMGIEMQPSKEFRQFGRMFIQDIDLLGDSIEEVTDRIIKNYDEERRGKLGKFIDKIFELNLTHHELQRLWSAIDSDIYFKTAEGFKTFLKMTRDRL